MKVVHTYHKEVSLTMEMVSSYQEDAFSSMKTVHTYHKEASSPMEILSQYQKAPVFTKISWQSFCSNRNRSAVTQTYINKW
jgi:hypothetical protein